MRMDKKVITQYDTKHVGCITLEELVQAMDEPKNRKLPGLNGT